MERGHRPRAKPKGERPLFPRDQRVLATCFERALASSQHSRGVGSFFVSLRRARRRRRVRRRLSPASNVSIWNWVNRCRTRTVDGGSHDTRGLRGSLQNSLHRPNRRRSGRDTSTNPTHKYRRWGQVLFDIFLLAEGDLFVGKFTSNFDRLVYALQVASPSSACVCVRERERERERESARGGAPSAKRVALSLSLPPLSLFRERERERKKKRKRESAWLASPNRSSAARRCPTSRSTPRPMTISIRHFHVTRSRFQSPIWSRSEVFWKATDRARRVRSRSSSSDTRSRPLCQN